MLVSADTLPGPGCCWQLVLVVLVVVLGRVFSQRQELCGWGRVGEVFPLALGGTP